MGIDRQPNCLTAMVVRTKNHEMTAAVATACRILSLTFPGKVPVEITADRIAIGEELWEMGALNDLVARISSMWIKWADQTSRPHRMLDEIMMTLERSGPPTVPPQPAADPDQTAARVHQLYAMDVDDLPDWGPSSDEDEVAFVPPPVPQWLPRPPPTPPGRRWVRIGVDLGGVLLPKFPTNRLGKLRTHADLSSLGYAPGAQEWFANAVAQCGPENIYVISYVSSQRLRELFSFYVCGPSGLLTRLGVPRANLIWTDTKASKAQPFIARALSHFIDDQVDVLTSIRAACWEQRIAAPTMFVVPTQWADGSSSHFGRVCADTANANTSWQLPWCLFPAPSVGDVRPWQGLRLPQPQQ